MIKLIRIQKLNPGSRAWETAGEAIHANVNKAGNGSTYMSSGSEQSKSAKTFLCRHNKELSEIQFAKQMYRIILDGRIYKISDYDDYQEQHVSIKLLGVSNGEKL